MVFTVKCSNGLEKNTSSLSSTSDVKSSSSYFRHICTYLRIHGKKRKRPAESPIEFIILIITPFYYLLQGGL